ncbi:MAG: hypothetical protein ABIN80_04970 [Dyadobacter sp.]|uniref:hypothetical protein n=1 Tax=Dyadobacter sp. TaxID=1914288 RepID=UPI00326788F4
MRQWINRLFNPENPAPAIIKKEGNVYLEGDKAIYARQEGYRKTVIDLAQLQYIYVYTTEGSQNLVLNNYSQHFVPCSATGFQAFFQHLSDRFLLDEKKFYEILASSKPQKVELWRADSPDNCKITDHPDSTEKGKCEGFWICSSPPQWISWDMTSQELVDSPLTTQTTNEYGLTELRFHFPVQIGNIILDDWRYLFPGHLRLDVPLDDFYSNVRISGNGDQNYKLLKKALETILGDAESIYERDDQNSCQWMVNGIKFALIYWSDSRYSYESGYAYFNVKNERTYPHYLTDPAYESNIELSKYLCLEHSFRIGSGFRQSRYFQQTPQKVANQLILSSAGFIFWRDTPNVKVGFANRENAMIFPLENLASFHCENVFPDRSSGGAYLSAILKEGVQQSILIGDCNSFDAYISHLTEMTQLPVTVSATSE